MKPLVAITAAAVAAATLALGAHAALPHPPAGPSSPGHVALPHVGYLPFAGTGRTVRGVTKAQVCTGGYATSVRPSVSYTEPLKRAQVVVGGTFTYRGKPARGYHYADHRLGDYEEDHIVPLSVGGSPTDPMNLYPEPLHTAGPGGHDAGAAVKDRYEVWTWHRLCAAGSTMTLAGAQARFRGDWYAHAVADKVLP